MYPSQHLVLGIIFSAIVLFLFPQIGFLGFLLIVLSTFFIDVDHYIYYAYRKRDFNLRNAYNHYIKNIKKLMSMPKKERKNYKKPIFIFHGIEFWILLLIISFFYKIIFFIFIGVMFHMLLDYFAFFYYGWSQDGKISQIYTLIRNKKKKELI